MGVQLRLWLAVQRSLEVLSDSRAERWVKLAAQPPHRQAKLRPERRHPPGVRLQPVWVVAPSPLLVDRAQVRVEDAQGAPDQAVDPAVGAQLRLARAVAQQVDRLLDSRQARAERVEVQRLLER